MNYLCIIFASILIIANSDPLSDDIIKYFKSDSVKSIRLVWDDHRTSVEDSLTYAMQETIGKDSLTKYKMNRTGYRLTKAYYLKHGPLNIILRNLNLINMPLCWMPKALLSLASNVLHIETELTKMFINAEYLVMRNKSDIIEGFMSQDPQKQSPFLYKQVLNIGQLTLTVYGCKLSGYVITKLRGGKVDLGHENFTLSNCQYTVTIHNNDSAQSPIKAKFSIKSAAYSLGIKQYLLMTIREEFLQKLQVAVSTHVNNSAIFGINRSLYEAAQETVFASTSSNLTKLIKEQNEKILYLSGGAVNLVDYVSTWDYWDSSFYNYPDEPVTIKLSKMVLTGLDTAYNSHTGGPHKFDTAMIGEQMRFSKLQVYGELSVRSRYEEIHNNFTIKISDFAINTEIKIDDAGANRGRIEVVGYRDIEFIQPELITGPLQTFIAGYVKNEVSKAIVNTIVIASSQISKSKSTLNSDSGVTAEESSSTSKVTNHPINVNANHTEELRNWIPKSKTNENASINEISND